MTAKPKDATPVAIPAALIERVDKLCAAQRDLYGFEPTRRQMVESLITKALDGRGEETRAFSGGDNVAAPTRPAPTDDGSDSE